MRSGPFHGGAVQVSCSPGLAIGHSATDEARSPSLQSLQVRHRSAAGCHALGAIQRMFASTPIDSAAGVYSAGCLPPTLSGSDSFDWRMTPIALCMEFGCGSWDERKSAIWHRDSVWICLQRRSNKSTAYRQNSCKARSESFVSEFDPDSGRETTSGIHARRDPGIAPRSYHHRLSRGVYSAGCLPPTLSGSDSFDWRMTPIALCMEFGALLVIVATCLIFVPSTCRAPALRKRIHTESDANRLCFSLVP